VDDHPLGAAAVERVVLEGERLDVALLVADGQLLARGTTACLRDHLGALVDADDASGRRHEPGDSRGVDPGARAGVEDREAVLQLEQLGDQPLDPELVVQRLARVEEVDVVVGVVDDGVEAARIIHACHVPRVARNGPRRIGETPRD
jgi:hypothetical protein